MQVTSKTDLLLLLAMKLPLYIALGALAWRLREVELLSSAMLQAVCSGLLLLFLCDTMLTLRANRRVLTGEVPTLERYSFRQVAILSTLYFATFGSELAVVSMLPLFFAETFGLSPVSAGVLASAYAVMNLMSRPGGGWLSDRFGRRPTLLILTAGLAAGYAAMGLIGADWPIWGAVAVAMACSVFVQAGEGAVFAVVPLIRRSLTGQIAGMAGAYGNVGAVVYLLVYALVDTATFFFVIASTAVLGFVALLFLEEPSGEISEVAADGTVIRIRVGLRA